MPNPRIFPVPNALSDHVTVLGVSTLVRASNPKRVDLELINDGDSVIYLSRGNVAVVGDGMRINPRGGRYRIFLTVVWRDTWPPITGDGNMCNMTVTEGVKP